MYPTAHAHRNVLLLQQRWPRLCEQLRQTPSVPSCFRPTDTPEVTLVIDGLHLTSGYDRQAEARLQARMIPEDAAEAWVYGAALGDLPRVLLERPALRRLHVVLLNPAIFAATTNHIDHTDWLRDERITLHLGAEQTDLHRPFAVAPACLLLADEATTRLRDLIQLELATPYLRRQHARRIHWPTRLQATRPFVASDGDVRMLFGTHPDGLFLVVGDGPSLTEGVDLVRSLRDRAPVLAVYEAYPALCAAGLTPDVVVAIDPERPPAPVPPDTPALVPPLVYFPAVPPEVLDRWSGLRLVAYPQRPDHPLRPLQEAYPRGTLFSAGSTLHATTDLAVKMGAGRILLVGADFTQPDADAADEAGNLLNGHGEPVGTTRAHRGALRDFERYVLAHPDVQFINASRRGAVILGTTYYDEIAA
ncbi:MAG: DUF115 domain-containing protein [Bacteroidetes bacterium]|nr:MAG: DUF115 domain-containing protein [Bacteroidota bacterium]